MPARKPVVAATRGTHVGYGKVILFGEHFVVYGCQAIVAGISEYTDCSISTTPGVPGVQVTDQRPAIPGYKREKRAEQEKAHQLVLSHLHIDTSADGLHIRLGGPLVPTSGIGASASDVVALSRALSELYGLNLSDTQVNESAFVGEGGYHGTPSGVDNTAATFGGLISFMRKDGKPAFRAIECAAPLYLVVVGTGITASTTKVVADVRKLKERHEAAFRHVLARYTDIVREAAQALRSGDVRRVGALMRANHQLCRHIGVSCDAIEAIVSRCDALGALGAKLSGTGRGGIVIALAESPAAQKALSEGLQASCPQAKFIWTYTVAPKVPPRQQAQTQTQSGGDASSKQSHL